MRNGRREMQVPRRPDTDRPVRLTTSLPESVRAPLDIFLWSEVENRVPKGAYQTFIIERIQEFFGWSRVDLEPYGLAGHVRGPKEACTTLEHALTIYHEVYNLKPKKETAP